MLCTLACSLIFALAPGDRDGDGLSDLAEQHKYGTDPALADSDGDGTPDGDWLERREYAYTVRSIVQVMKPVTPDVLDADPYQDARVLDETADYVELEVIHYPFATVAGPDPEAAEPDPKWLAPGPTSDWTPAMAQELKRRLNAEGIDPDSVATPGGVERVTAWLLQHARSHDGFSTFATSFDGDGQPYVVEELQGWVAKRRTIETPDWTLDEQREREISARGMFEHGYRGSCSSSGIYMAGCLRALGLPARIVLCIPIIDASDKSEWRLVAQGIEHHRVRDTIETALEPSRRGWTSHTFLEVWIEGRWRRLNYTKLDQPILDRDYLGLMTHVATFRDWADARMPRTLGMRQMVGPRDDVFGHGNPYSTIALRDAFGEHCSEPNPPLPPAQMTVVDLHWTDSKTLPANIVEHCKKTGRFGLVAEIPATDGATASRVLTQVDPRIQLTNEGRPTIYTYLDRGCHWGVNGTRYIYVPLASEGPEALQPGVPYAVTVRHESPPHLLNVALTVAR